MKGLSKGRYDETFAGEDGTRYGASFTILALYLDPHCTFASKIKSADICKDWVRS